jgi:hypothetical protein
VNHLVEPVGVLVVARKPPLVLEVDAHDDLLYPEDGLHRLKELEELVKVLAMEHLVRPVARLRLGAVDDQARLRVLPLEVRRKPPTAGPNDASLAHDLDGIVLA